MAEIIGGPGRNEKNEENSMFKAIITNAIMTHPELSDEALVPIVKEALIPYLQKQGEIVLSVKEKNLKIAIEMTRKVLTRKKVLG